MIRTRLSLIGLICSCLVFLSACDPSEAPTSALNNDVEDVLAPLAGDIVPGQYIVVLKDRSEFAGKTVRQVLDDMTSAEGIETSHVYENAIRGFAGHFSDVAIERVRNNPLVKYVEKDRVVTLPITIEGNKGKKPPKNGGGEETSTPAQVTPWGIHRVGGFDDGTAKTAWVIDTGVDLDHPDLNVDQNRSRSYLTGRQSNNPDDQHGHGTHVAGTIAAINNNEGVVGVAAGAQVVSVRVLDRRGSGTTSGVIAGVDYVAASGSDGDVANMSLGGGISQALDDAVVAASTSVMFTLAAGNSSDNADNHSPARANGNNIYTVSAIDSDDAFAWFSNYGNPPIDFAAPGVSILSLWKNGGINTISGTSMAAPHVAGLLLFGDPQTDDFSINDPDSNPDPIAHR